MNASVVLDIYEYCMEHTNNEFFYLGMLKKRLIRFSDSFNFPFLRKLISGITLLPGENVYIQI